MLSSIHQPCRLLGRQQGRQKALASPVIHQCSCGRGIWPLQSWAASPTPHMQQVQRRRHALLMPPPRAVGIENRELLVGDMVALVSFSLYKQIASIVLSPSFPGWTAPLHFNPDRWFEFVSFTATLCGSWALAAALTGGFAFRSTESLPAALRATSWAWLVSMPVAAAQLVLLTALESRALVGTEGFADALPLAAQGPGEPVATAAGLLGVMCVWRAAYTVWLYPFSSAAAQEWAAEAQAFREALTAAAALAAVGGAALQVVKALTGQLDAGAF